MKTAQDKFIYVISEECVIDLGKLSEHDWDKIKAEAKRLLKTKETDDKGMAHIIAFVFFISDLQHLAHPYDPEQDLHH